MRKLPVVVVALGSLLASAAMAGQPQVIVCHFPPGQPENVQAITVAERAVPAHLAHGDTLGILQCGGDSVLCVPEGCGFGCVSCCPPCSECPPPPPEQCVGAACSCEPGCGCFTVGLP